jgi:hypothetical protein
MSSLRLPAAALILVACGRETPPPPAGAPVPAATTPAASPPPAPSNPTAPAAVAPRDTAAAPGVTCEPAETVAAANALRLDVASLDASGRLRACGELPEGRGCLAVDPVTGRRELIRLSADDVDHLPAWPPGFDDGLRLEDERPVTRVCTPATQGCKVLHPDRAATARFNADRTQAVLTVVNAEGAETGGKTLFVYDVHNQGERLSVKLDSASVGDCSFARFAGPNLVVGVTPCDPPPRGAVTAWLAEPLTGNRVAPVGGTERPVGLHDGHLAQLEGDRWAFRAADGASLIVQDVRTGAVEAAIDLGPPPSATRSAAFVLATGPNQVLVAAQSPNTPLTITRVDLASRNAAALTPPPACP